MTVTDTHAHHADSRHPDGGPPSSTPAHDSHGQAGHGKHAGHHVEMFRRRFWVSLVLSLPVVATSHMVMDWLGYELDFAGMEWVGPVLGSVVFLWGGWPFLEGGLKEVRERQPGMMLLIAMARSASPMAPRWPRRSTGSISTSGGSCRCSSPSCCWATGRR